VLIRRLVSSRAGRAMIASEQASPPPWASTSRYLVLATIVSAAMAGAAGGLRASAHRRPRRVPVHLHRDDGHHGDQRRQGYADWPIVGGLIFGLLPELLRGLQIAPEVQWVVYGVLMILVVYFLPEGIVPAVRDWWQRRHDKPTEPAVTTEAAR
jgi:branched-chain amino acid transport system permease protein